MRSNKKLNVTRLNAISGIQLDIYKEENLYKIYTSYMGKSVEPIELTRTDVLELAETLIELANEQA